MSIVKLRIITIVLIFIQSISLTQAQESINSSGGNAIGGGGNASYSIGQVFYTTLTGNNGVVAQGVQHAYEIFTTGVDEPDLITSLYAFPNPISDNLILQSSNYGGVKLFYELLDLQGKLIDRQPINSFQTKISMINLQNSVYIFNIVNQESNIVKAFKIIKK